MIRFSFPFLFFSLLFPFHRKRKGKTEKGNFALDFRAMYTHPSLYNTPTLMQKWFSVSTNSVRLRFPLPTWARILTYLSDANYEHYLGWKRKLYRRANVCKMERKKRRGKKKKRDGFPGLIFRKLRAKHLVIFKDNKHESEEKPVSCVSASR